MARCARRTPAPSTDDLGLLVDPPGIAGARGQHPDLRGHRHALDRCCGWHLDHADEGRVPSSAATPGPPAPIPATRRRRGSGSSRRCSARWRRCGPGRSRRPTRSGGRSRRRPRPAPRCRRSTRCRRRPSRRRRRGRSRGIAAMQRASSRTIIASEIRYVRRVAHPANASRRRVRTDAERVGGSGRRPTLGRGSRRGGRARGRPGSCRGRRPSR